MNKVEEFNAYRQKMNDWILGSENKGSICIPHTRRAMEYSDELHEAK